MKRTKKRFVIGTAFAVGAAATLTGCCVPYLKPQPQPSVYGPPEYLEEPSEAFVPEEEVQEDVYGPPGFFEETSEVFTPEEEVQEDVYGPPEFFDEGR